MDTTLSDPLVGQVLDGRYRIEARIAVGGMASVYRAVDIRLDRVLALKVMHQALAADAAFVDRFIREARSVARLDHPNIVSVFDQGADGPHVYLAMEYVAGCTLREVLRRRGALQPRAALDVLEPVLAALGAAHRAGLVHRDMKPENVLIGDDGRVKVADFGLVRAVGTDTTATTGFVLGTVSYLAPEQIEEGVTDQRSDVYACGVMLYEMLTGAKPHEADTAAAVLYQHLHRDVGAPSAVVAGLDPRLDALVAAAAARDAAARPADAVALLAEVRAVRAALSDPQLDLVPPPAAAVAVAGDGPDDEGTAVLRRDHLAPDGATDRLNRTSLLQVPVGLGLRSDDPLDDQADADRRGRRSRAAGRRRGSRRGATALVTALLVLLGAGALVWYVSVGQFTTVPPVLAISQAKAVQRLRDAGLGVRIGDAYSPTVAAGLVISSDPGPGARIRGNGVVGIVVSRGPQQAPVPQVAGLPLAQAQQKVTAVGLAAGAVTQSFSDTVPAGSVISTDPPAGTVRAAGSAVAFTVSRGRPVTVPNEVGASLSDAEQALQAAGLKVTVAGTPVYSDTVPQNSVARQSPGAGGQLARGDTVTLTVSRGPQLVRVPDVTGQSVSAARRTLRAAGFKVRVVRLFVTGKVFAESPDGGSMQPKNSVITLWAR